LSKRVEAADANFIWVASGSSTEAELLEFKATYAVHGTLLHDTDREIVAAIGARSTPSAVLLEPSNEKNAGRVKDFWYPYLGGHDGLVEGRVTGNMMGVFRPGEYRGNQHCAACHSNEHLSWALTHHSIAWRTLEQRGAHTDPKCTGCHVTGNGQPTGWDGTPHSKLTDVGCESCHGPGGPHDGTRADPKESCAQCHDADHSIDFSVGKGLPLIDHYRGYNLTEEQVQKAVTDLYEGRVPRALLAFPEGVQVGAAACQSCHASEHMQWSMSRHSGAMASLDKDDKHKDPACVRCHATAKMSGPPPAALGDFHTGEGVGCESCHGPGEAHVKAPSKDNIEGLGDDCPVCVIEAVCTNCHTAEWDPRWDLDLKLPKVGHGTAP
jgi:hypothetical protein